MPSTSSSPQRPQLRVRLRAPAAIAASGIRAVDAGRVDGPALIGRLLRDAAGALGAEPGDRPVHDVAVVQQPAPVLPLPAGLPVSTRSPGSSGMVWEVYETSVATPKIMSLVDSSCMVLPLSFSVTCRS